MKARRPLALLVLAVALACEDHRPPTGPTGLVAPADPSAMISDGAHGGNPDFFFLPPLVSDPSSNPNFEQGKFNAALQPSLTVEICELQAAPVDANGLPVLTDCIAGPPLKKFPAGTVKLQQVDPNGYYQVVWNTQQSNLDVTKYYRIKVLIEGATVPFGVADLDPVANMKEFKNARTGEVIPLNDDSTLPIKFRVERGAACNGGLCNSVTVTNTSPTGSTIVTLDGGAGAIAGAKFPNGWLPSTGPQSVVVTIADVNTGVSNPATGSESVPCHPNLPLEQFRGCFNFSTTPALTPIDESGTQFAIPVTVASCYVLEGTGDPREKFAEMWSSGPNEPPHALPDASDVGILGPDARNCATNIITLNNSKGVTGLANSGWRKLKGGLGRLFGVQTAYAVDLGLGGFASEFSNVGPALSALIEPVGATTLTVAGGGTAVPFVRIVGSNHHDGKHQNATGIGGVLVTFVASAGSTISPQGTEGGTATQLTATTNTLPTDGSSTSGGGYAAVNWTIPSTPGTYTLTANSLVATGGPVTFIVTVPATAQNFTNTGSMNVARLGHTTTVLNNGMVLVAGGQDASAELYNPATGTFTTTGSMTAARGFHTATLLNNGMVLITGGGNTALLASAELYNPGTGSFTATGSMTTARHEHTATLLHNGMVLIAGGSSFSVTGGFFFISASAELYDPTTGTFTSTGSMTPGEVDHTATLLNNGMVLIAGGTDATGTTSASAQLYNPATGTFTTTGSLNTARTYHTATLLNSGMTLIAGGTSSANTLIPLAGAELYNPATGIFTPTGSLNTARSRHTATLLNNGTVLFAGGTEGFSGINSLASAELYDPATATFAATGSLNTGRQFHRATLLNNGIVLITGGTGGSSAELYGAILPR